MVWATRLDDLQPSCIGLQYTSAIQAGFRNRRRSNLVKSTDTELTEPGFRPERKRSLKNANQLKGSSGEGLDTTLSFFNIFRERPIDFQMRFFQASDMSAEQTLTATQVVPLFYSAVPINPTNSNSLLYETKMRSFEANIVYRTPFRIRLLTGFRFFEVDEIYDVVDNVSSSSSTRVGFFLEPRIRWLAGK